MAMNRQTKRRWRSRAPTSPSRAVRRREAATPVRRSHPGADRSPCSTSSEVQGELRKVAWPTKKEVINSTIIVLIAVIVMTALIFGFDYVSSKFVLFLFD